MKKLEQEQISKRERVSGWVMIILFLVVTVLSVSRVFMANRLVGVSENLRKLDLEAVKLEQENQTLGEEVRVAQAIKTIEIEAVSLGFIKNNHFAYLTPTAEIALR